MNVVIAMMFKTRRGLYEIKLKGIEIKSLIKTNKGFKTLTFFNCSLVQRPVFPPIKHMWESEHIPVMVRFIIYVN